MIRGRFVAAIAALAMLSGCATDDLYSPAPGQKMKVDAATFAAFQRYQQRIGATHDGAFAVSMDGTSSASRSCPSSVCQDSSGIAARALRDCAQSGQKCYLFARRNDIRVDYQVVP